MRKDDFPIFNEKIYGKDLVFLDSAASAQKPKAVLDAMYEMAVKEYANVHRGAYYLSEMATNDFEQARQAVADFIHARPKDIIFTRGATDAINLVAGTYGRTLKAGDEIVLSIAEHHSNLVPWQLLRDEKGVVLKFIDVTEDGLLDMEAYRAALTEKTKLVAMTHMSNVLGTMFPVKEITRLAHEAGAKVLIDGCQGIVHTPTDVAAIGCDWYAFSGHKIYGPTGIGVLYGRWEVMNELLPLQGGGDMVKSVHTDHSVYADSPARFEAGTPAIVETVGLRAAIAYVTGVGMADIEASEEKLMAMTALYEAAVNSVVEYKNTEYTDFHARRLVEMAGHIIMGYLLLSDATRNDAFTKSANVYVRYGEAEVRKLHAFVTEFRPEELNSYK